MDSEDIKMMSFRLLAIALASTCALSIPLAHARQSAQEQRAAKTAQIPTCQKKLGTIAVLEPDDNWWSSYELSSPAALIKVFVNKSRCFTLVDRGKGLSAMQLERDLGADGELRNRSNLGKGQIKAADYALVPDLISRNSDAGGTNIAGALGGLLGGKVGRAFGGVNLKKKTADVVLTITDMRSSEQVAMTEGHASKTDIGFSGSGAGLISSSLAGGAGVSSYSNTEIGQVMTMAYLQAYTDLVAQLGGLPSNASEANAQQAVSLTKPARLLANPDGKGSAVRDLDPGMLLYPTGKKQGIMWEVEDEMGNKGWVSSASLEMAR
jgi:curli biogenesis system outer membrane secretion channel CsgG